MNETLVKVENISKKFCRDLKRSLWYGLKDLGNEVLCRPHNGDRKLRKDEFWAVKDVSFELKRGECIGLIGRNGAGKTTLLRMLNGLIKPDKGRIEIRGQIGALIALGAGFNPVLTGRENIYVNGAVLGLSKRVVEEKIERIIDFADIRDFIDAPVQNYSSGMQVRLGFAVTTALDPDVLIIDEILAVGDIGFRAKCYSVISEFMKNSAVVFVSHSMPEIARLCNRVLVMKLGEYVYLGDNVSEGIDQYHRAHKKPQGVNFSSPEGEFEEIIIESEKKNNNIPSISFSDDISIFIRARLSQKIKNPIFHVAFLNQSLQNVCHCSSFFKNNALISKNGIYNIKLTIRSLTLRPGKYYLDFAITEDDNVKIIARTHLSHEIQITGSIPGYGTILAFGEWEIIN